MVGFVRAVQDSSRPSTADSTSTSDATSRPTTANDGDQETEDKDKDEDEAMSLDWLNWVTDFVKCPSNFCVELSKINCQLVRFFPSPYFVFWFQMNVGMMVVCLIKFTLYVQNFCLFFFSQELMIAL